VLTFKDGDEHVSDYGRFVTVDIEVVRDPEKIVMTEGIPVGFVRSMR
jgi:hypothetical protein